MVVVKDHQQREPSMGDITTIGLDLAKSVFQVHAIDEAGSVMMRKRLRRSQVLAFFAKIPPCLVGLEACGTAHHWARELIALGHEARLMPPNYVKAYVKTQQARRGRCRGDLRGGSASVDALRTGKNSRPTVGTDDASGSGFADPPAYHARHCFTWPLGRVRFDRGSGPTQSDKTDCDCHGRDG
jgi:hypothetical protein